MLALLSLSLRLRGFLRTRSSLQNHLLPANGLAGSSGPALTVRMVRAAVRHSWVHATCLEESLVLWWLLGRQGIASELRVGVRKQGAKFEAHAWVECAGAALNDPLAQHEHYAAFDSALASLPREPQ